MLQCSIKQKFFVNFLFIFIQLPLQPQLLALLKQNSQQNNDVKQFFFIKFCAALIQTYRQAGCNLYVPSPPPANLNKNLLK